MRKVSSATRLGLITAIFWGLTAGLIPYPAIVGLGMGGGVSGVLQAAQQSAHWLVVSSLVAGAVGGASSAPLMRRERLPHLYGLALWVFTGVFAAAFGFCGGTIFDGWRRATLAGQPYPLDVLNPGNLTFLGMVLTVGLVPLGAWGVVTYPAFVQLRRTTMSEQPVSGRHRLPSGRSWLLAFLTALVLLLAVSPRFADDGLSRYGGEERRVAERASVMIVETLHPLERALVVQRLGVEGVRYLPNDVGQPHGARYHVSLTAFTAWWVRYANFSVWYGDDVVKIEGGRMPTFWRAAGILAPVLGLAGFVLAAGTLYRAVRQLWVRSVG